MTTSVRRIAAFVVMLAAVNLARAELPQRAALQILEPNSTDWVDSPDEAPSPPWLGAGMAMQGNVALVGMSGAFDARGRVAAFVRDASGKWMRRQTLTASNAAPGALFGEHIAIFNSRALITSSSAVYIFQLTSSTWREVGKLAFGRTVQVRDLDWHWNTVVVGASDSTGNAAYVFHMNTAGTFTRIARLAPLDAVAGDLFGERVAVFSSTVAATAPGYNSEQGAVYTFACSETQCAQRQKLLANDGQPGDTFGSAVDLASGVLIVGAQAADWEPGDPAEPPSEQNHRAGGSAYLFMRSNSTWTEQQKLHPSARDLNWYASFGYQVTASGTHVVIGAPYNVDTWEPGYVIDYRWSGGALVANKIMVGEASHGHALALYNDALFAGSPNNPGFFGAAAVYNLAQ
jgi:FG-GAP repeat